MFAGIGLLVLRVRARGVESWNLHEGSHRIQNETPLDLIRRQFSMKVPVNVIFPFTLMSTVGPFLTGFNIKIRRHFFIVTHAAPPPP